MEIDTEQTKLRANQPASMSQKLAWLKAIHADIGLNPATKNVAVGLFMHHNEKDGRCNPKQKTLAAALGLKLRRVNEGIKALHDAGWIASVRTRGASYYRLNIPAEAEMRAAAHISEEAMGARYAPPHVADTRQGTQQIRATARMEPSSSTVPMNRLSLEENASGEVRQGSKRQTQRQTTGTPLPANFELTEQLRGAAQVAGVRVADIDKAFAMFRSHALANGRTCSDWDAAWTLWCETRAERQQRDAVKEQPKRSRWDIPRSAST